MNWVGLASLAPLLKESDAIMRDRLLRLSLRLPGIALSWA